MPNAEDRLDRLEARLSNLERQLAHAGGLIDSGREVSQPKPVDHLFKSPARHYSTPPDISITQILGWTGATALVLAVLSGFLLIGAGLRLRSADREYASLLPAGGLVVLGVTLHVGGWMYKKVTAIEVEPETA
jgi:hypothetical protein